MKIIETIGIISSVVMPLFNISLIVKIRRRKSSADISLIWTVGIWICTLLMLPSGLVSGDIPFKCYAIVNFILFSLTAWHILRYKHGRL